MTRSLARNREACGHATTFRRAQTTRGRPPPEPPLQSHQPDMARTIRSELERISDLEARIEQLKARIESKKVKKDPALRFITKAVKAIDAGAAETKDVPLREALEQARATLAACLSLTGVMVPQAGPRRGRGARVSTGVSVDRAALLQYVRKNPGQRGEQISAALGTTSTDMRPVMKDLIEAGEVKSKGERRATTYAAV